MATCDHADGCADRASWVGLGAGNETLSYSCDTHQQMLELDAHLNGIQTWVPLPKGVAVFRAQLAGEAIGSWWTSSFHEACLEANRKANSRGHVKIFKLQLEGDEYHSVLDRWFHVPPELAAAGKCIAEVGPALRTGAP